MLRVASLVVFVSTITAAACTQDFGTFEGGEGGGTPAPPSGTSNVDGSTNPPANDGGSSSGNPVDGGGTSDTGTGGTCADKATCITTGRTCRDGCGPKFDACQNACPQGQPGENCKKACENDRKTCEQTCSSTCKSCAGGACDRDCP